MRINLTLVTILLFCHIFKSSQSTPLHLVSAAISALSISFGFVFKDPLMCHFSECCLPPWVAFNHTAFEESLKQRVYGQPLLYRLSDAINDHWNNRQPSKALTVALHGPTGTGKNYAVRILAEHLFRQAARSKFFHFFSATVHFPHQRLIDIYADQIHEWVRGNVSLCKQSVFVFDEIDKMPHTLLDRLKPFVDYHEHINGVDYRRAIFIFLSNSGSELIMRRMVLAKRNGSSRQQLASSAEFDHLLSKHAFTDSDSALRNSALLQHHLISRFVPFLPLEREHVIGCVKDYLNSHHPQYAEEDGIIKAVLQQLPFVPTEEEFFSSAGCKRIIDKTLMVLSDL